MTGMKDLWDGTAPDRDPEDTIRRLEMTLAHVAVVQQGNDEAFVCGICGATAHWLASEDLGGAGVQHEPWCPVPNLVSAYVHAYRE